MNLMNDGKRDLGMVEVSEIEYKEAIDRLNKSHTEGKKQPYPCGMNELLESKSFTALEIRHIKMKHNFERCTFTFYS